MRTVPPTSRGVGANDHDSARGKSREHDSLHHVSRDQGHLRKIRRKIPLITEPSRPAITKLSYPSGPVMPSRRLPLLSPRGRSGSQEGASAAATMQQRPGEIPSRTAASGSA